MRRFITFLLILTMLTASVIPAFAANRSNIDAEVYHSQGSEQTNGTAEAGKSEVKHGVKHGYVVKIPAYIQLLAPIVGSETDSDEKEGEVITEYRYTSATVSVSEVYLTRAQTLKISMKSDNYDGGWKIKHTSAPAQKLNYTISKEKSVSGSIEQHASVLDCPGGTASEESVLYFGVTDFPRVGGTYEDYITFTVSIATKTN